MINYGSKYVKAEDVEECFTDLDENGNIRTTNILSKRHPGQAVLIDIDEAYRSLMFKVELKDLLDNTACGKLSLDEVCQELKRLLEPEFSNGAFDPVGLSDRDDADKTFEAAYSRGIEQLGNDWLEERASNIMQEGSSELS